MPRKALTPILIMLMAILVIGLLLWNRHPAKEPPMENQVSVESAARIEKFCAACHDAPKPESFPKQWWVHVIKTMYDFYDKSTDENIPKPPPYRDAVEYYTERAPNMLPFPSYWKDSPKSKSMFELTKLKMPLGELPTGVANVRFVTMAGEKRPKLFISDFGTGISVADFGPQPHIDRLFTLDKPPCKIEVVDLDKDGRQDLLVASLGIYFPSDERAGSVIWLRNTPSGYKPITLLKDVGRVTDVRAADFDGDGDLDLVVSCFGWHINGAIIYLENQTTDWNKPTFEPFILDTRTGAISNPIIDINNDGKPDFVALISQEHEKVVAFINKGNAQFEKQIVFDAHDPSWGSDGITLVDLDNDGDLDILMANGDALDYGLAKPYHGIMWLENKGTLPFTPHSLAKMYGAHCVKAADLDGDGDLDIVASAFFPTVTLEKSKKAGMETLMWLEQTSPGQYERHSFELDLTPVCPSFDLADIDGDGRIDIAFGCFVIKGSHQIFMPDYSIGILRNKGR